MSFSWTVLTFVEGVFGAAQLSLAKGDDFVGVLVTGVAFAQDSVFLDSSFLEGDSDTSLDLLDFFVGNW